MNYKGVIIEESLENKDVLQDVAILSTKVEQVTEKYHTPHLKQWTLHTVEVPEDRGEDIAEKLSEVLDTRHVNWYADFRNKQFHYIIFKNKIFKVDRSNPNEYEEAKRCGISLGIPEYQLTFSSEIEE